MTGTTPDRVRDDAGIATSGRLAGIAARDDAGTAIAPSFWTVLLAWHGARVVDA